MRITKAQARRLAKDFDIDLEVVSFESWHFGLNVELEHGRKFGKLTNITNNSTKLSAKIAIAHLMEFPDYYSRLRKMEDRAEEYWSRRKTPNIFRDRKG